MGVEQHESFPHWNYLLALEEDLDRLSRFVEFTTNNYECYSIELARVLMLASAEVDVVAKQLCVQIAPKSHADSINDYRTIILSAHSAFPTYTLTIPRHGLALRPWSNWLEGENPIWWHAHNNVKHNRHTHFAEANLKNALNAVGALFLMIIHLHATAARAGKLAPNPKLYKVGEPIVADRSFWGERTNTYAIPTEMGNEPA
jgi:hypothetical protein